MAKDSQKDKAHDAAMKRSSLAGISADAVTVGGPRFDDYRAGDSDGTKRSGQGSSVVSDMLRQYYHRIGFQATQLGEAINIVNTMLQWRLSAEPVPEEATDLERDPEYRKSVRCKIYLGYTSNMISSGLRDIFAYLARHRMIDVIVTTAGGIEEDFIKCLAPTYVLKTCGLRDRSDAALRANGLNRIGNLLVPNDNYCKFEDWIMPILDQMVRDQNEHGVKWTPSRIIHRLGREINHPDSVYYWCYRNNIPVFAPALTDGSLGDMIYFHTFRTPVGQQQLQIDLVEDIRLLNSSAVQAPRTGMIILGGGLVKHHICNANLMRNGADYAVYINTAQEFDGSDAGASPEEAISWGKIRIGARSVKVCADATLIFPLLVAETFACGAAESGFDS